MKFRLSFVKQRTRICATKSNADGEILHRVTESLVDTKQINKVAYQLGIDADEFRRCLSKFEKGEGGEFELESPDDQFTITVRSLWNTDSVSFQGDPVAEFEKILETASFTFFEPNITWDNEEVITALDYDVDPDDSSTRFTDERLAAFLDTLNPLPRWAWVTKSKGFRLVYHASGAFTANEIASIAYLRIMNSLRVFRLEFKTATRHPLYPDSKGKCCGRVFTRPQELTPVAISAFLKDYTSISDQERDEWLEERGFEIGNRYDHTRCPVAPSAKSGNDPLIVNDDGIKCFTCEANSVTHGSKIPGWFPYLSLIPSGNRSTEFRNLLANFTHWDHAKYVMKQLYGLREDISKLIYSTCLKLTHSANHPMISRVFATGTGFLRFSGYWGSELGEDYHQRPQLVIQNLPAIYSGTNINPDKLAKFLESHDLTPFGYPALTPVHGIELCRNASQRKNYYPIVVHTKLKSPSMEQFRSRYLELSERLSWDEIDKYLNRVYPKINLRYLAFVIACRGLSEGNSSAPPIAFVTGPSSSAKTTTVKIAADILGDNVAGCNYHSDQSRLFQTIYGLKSMASFLLMDEWIKGADRANVDIVKSLSVFLDLTPEASAWKMFVGPVLMGMLPVFVLTDTTIPEGVIKNKQIARRMAHVELYEEVDWETVPQVNDMSNVINFRSSSLANAKVADSLISHIMDDCFRGVPLTFQQIVKRYGFRMMYDSESVTDDEERLREFFHLVCREPGLQGEDKHRTRWQGKGWKVISLNTDDDLSILWRSFSDQNTGGDLHSSRRCDEVNWQQLMNAPEPIKFECRNHGNKIAVRFKSVTNSTRKTYRVNDELLESRTDPMELETPIPDVSRRGNSIDFGFEGLYNGTILFPSVNPDTFSSGDG